MLAHDVVGKEEIDAIMEQTKKAGAMSTDPAHDRFWGGHSDCFQYPDGHLWEIAWNPQMEIKE